MLTKILILVLFLGLTTCNSANDLVSRDGGPSIQRESFDFYNKSPIDFISYLKTTDEPCVTIWRIYRGWIKEKDIPQLIELLDSDEPCAPVQMAISSLPVSQRSTVGNEAAFLIEGFRKDRYPPDLNSTHYWKPNINKIRQWWDKYSK